MLGWDKWGFWGIVNKINGEEREIDRKSLGEEVIVDVKSGVVLRSKVSMVGVWGW